MAFAEIRGAQLFYADNGAPKRPMLFVHGLSCDSHDWSWQIAHYASTHRIIAVDLRGHGRSSIPDDGYEVQSLAADMAALLDHLKSGPVIAVGHSLGGAVVAWLAVERPDLVAVVVGVDPGYLLLDESAPMLSGALAEYERQEPSLTDVFDGIAHVAATPPALAVWHKRREVRLPAHVARQALFGLIGGPAPLGLRANFEPHMRKIVCPILSIYVDPTRTIRTGEAIPSPSKSVCFEGCGHWIHQERPAEINWVIDTWLAGLPE